jgi:ABC-type transport system involved in cytochrome c biogenesis permease subunit
MNKVQRITFIALLVVAALLVLRSFQPPPNADGFNTNRLGQMPVQHAGRIQPLDTLARNTLLFISGRQSVTLEDGTRLPASIWITEMMARPEVAAEFPVFRIDNTDLLGLFGWTRSSKKFFSYNDLSPHFETIQRQFANVNPEPQLRSPFQRGVVRLFESLTIYHQLLHSFHSFSSNLDELELEYNAYRLSLEPGMAALLARQRGEAHDSEALDRLMFFADRYNELSRQAYMRIVPPGEENDLFLGDWANVGASLLDSMMTGEFHPFVAGYAELTLAYRSNNTERFNRALDQMKAHLGTAYQKVATAASREATFNYLSPFNLSIVLYLFAFCLVLVSWMIWPQVFSRAAFWITFGTFAIHTIGLILRMVISGRPPVTNLYSSAIFVGWGAVGLGLIIERFYRNGIGTAIACMVGIGTLLVAHYLSLSGDTLAMLVAVLDSNFWLATHVIVITLGYSAMFVAGAIAIMYVIMGLFTNQLNADKARSLARMTYGILCFALLFSFVGTMLGGIWADQSWGRFWGWDPKENGALLIVIWGAIILHARWGGIVREKGIMIMAIFGNVVTSWSWFGTNMLGVGLHSYGFMDGAFVTLTLFVISQLILMGMGALPYRMWRSDLAVLDRKRARVNDEKAPVSALTS